MLEVTVLRIIGTLHNRRGDPLILLRFLRDLNRDHKLDSIGVTWSVPSGNTEPGWDELVEEEGRIQETLRDRVRMVHESSLSWDAKSFLGRCYRSFQYEFMVSLNLKRRDRRLKLLLIDDPHVRDLRYREIGETEALLREIETIPPEQQADGIRTRYTGYRVAYEEMEVYEQMILHPNSVLLETSLRMAEYTQSRQEHAVRMVRQFEPDVMLLRLYQCLTKPSDALKTAGIYTDWKDFLGGSVPSTSIMKLSEAESIVDPLPDRD